MTPARRRKRTSGTSTRGRTSTGGADSRSSTGRGSYTDLDDLEPPLRMIGFNTNNYFGQQLKTDWNGFRLLGMRRPKCIDLWNVDVDYLSTRTKDFPALGSEMGWFGTDLIRDLMDPYHELRDARRTISPTTTSATSTSGG